MITYEPISLFDAPPGSVLVHACNCQGVWGGGIAAEFARRFPEAYAAYKRECIDWGWTLPGEGHIFPAKEYDVGCLFTSEGFGNAVDPPGMILENTWSALHDILELSDGPIFSNKFNSGLFGVPWEDTEKLLKDAVKSYEQDWVVCDPDVKEIKRGIIAVGHLEPCTIKDCQNPWHKEASVPDSAG